MSDIATACNIEDLIHTFRSRKVILDKDLAKLYGVPTKVLNQAVRRNLKRFPDDFMFQLDGKEVAYSRSQFVTLKRGTNVKYLPYAFTEQSVAMLSSVLNSERAIEINIAIMRAFVKMRELSLGMKNLTDKLSELEGRIDKTDESVTTIFEAIRQLVSPPDQPKRKIGFHGKSQYQPV